MGLTELIMKKIGNDKGWTDSYRSVMSNHVEDTSVDEVLKALIEDVDLMEVISCLDLIMQDEHDLRLIAHHVNPQFYPVVGKG